MEVSQLRHLVAIVRAGSYVAGAKELGMSQSALSRSIQKLESNWGLPLLERGRRGTQPTAFGSRLLVHAQAVLAELEQAHLELEGFRKLEAGRISLGLSSPLAEKVAPALVRRIWSEKPGLQISVSVDYFTEVLDLLRSGQIDFAACITPVIMKDPDLQWTKIFGGRSYIVGRAEHPVFAGDRKVLKEGGWIAPQAIESDFMNESFFQRHGLPVPERLSYTNSFALMKQAILENDLLSYMPESYVTDELKSGALRIYRKSQYFVDYLVVLAQRKNAASTPAIEFATNILREELRRIGA